MAGDLASGQAQGAREYRGLSLPWLGHGVQHWPCVCALGAAEMDAASGAPRVESFHSGCPQAGGTAAPVLHLCGARGGLALGPWGHCPQRDLQVRDRIRRHCQLWPEHSTAAPRVCGKGPCQDGLNLVTYVLAKALPPLCTCPS